MYKVQTLSRALYPSFGLKESRMFVTGSYACQCRKSGLLSTTIAEHSELLYGTLDPSMTIIIRGHNFNYCLLCHKLRVSLSQGSCQTSRSFSSCKIFKTRTFIIIWELIKESIYSPWSRLLLIIFSYKRLPIHLFTTLN